MEKKFKVLMRKGGRFTTYRICETRQEAENIMSDLNVRFINKAYDRQIKKGKRGLSHTDWYWALNQTAIQY
jgi:hypothetical protein